MLQGMTAQYLAVSTYPIREADACLVHAAAGGVGQLLCQVARRRGSTLVIGTVSSPEKARVAREAGAHETIDYTRQDFEAETRRLTQGRGVPVVYDSVGRATFEKSLGCLAQRGMLVLFGQSSGPVEPVDLQVLSRKGSLYVTRPTLFHYVATREELLSRSGDVLAWVRDGTLRLRIDRELPLADAARAHEALEGRKTAGKVLLVP
jgi:NADPH2:quinone reductase